VGPINGMGMLMLAAKVLPPIWLTDNADEDLAVGY
jgi:hypothetical protein